MALVVVGGQSRKVGKTSVVAGLIAALPEFDWTAVKITQHEHGLAPGQRFSILEERDRSGSKDTCRYLAAGARRALLVRTRPGALGEAVPNLQQEIASGNAILESNRIVEFLRPDVYVLVIDPAMADVKESAARGLGQADVVLAAEGEPAGDLKRWLRGKRIVQFRPPEYVPPELVGFVRSRLGVSG